MSTISETIFEQYATTPENKALEKMQADVCDLTRIRSKDFELFATKFKGTT